LSVIVYVVIIIVFEQVKIVVALSINVEIGMALKDFLRKINWNAVPI